MTSALAVEHYGLLALGALTVSIQLFRIRRMVKEIINTVSPVLPVQPNFAAALVNVWSSSIDT